MMSSSGSVGINNNQAFLERLKDDQYKNWLKGAQCLAELCKGLVEFCEKESEDFHKDLKKKVNIQKTCGTCKSKSITFKNQLKTSCPNGVCDHWIQQIAANHKLKDVYWSNCDLGSVPTIHWEVAKCYMNRGQKKSNQGAATSDTSALLNLLRNCKPISAKFEKKNIVEKASQKRNQLMHSSQMTWSDDDLKDCVDILVKLLSDAALSSKHDAGQAILAIKQIYISQINISVEDYEKIELDVLKAKMQELENTVNETQKITPELEKALTVFAEFLKKNPDLLAKFQGDINELQDKMESLQDRMNSMEGKQEQQQQTIEKILVAFEKLEIGCSTVATDNSSVPAKNFKNALQDYTQSNKLHHPFYESITPPDGRGFGAKVTIAGKTYCSDRQNYPRKRMAEQDVARVALKSIGKLGEQPGTAGSATPDGIPETVEDNSGKPYKQTGKINLNNGDSSSVKKLQIISTNQGWKNLQYNQSPLASGEVITTVTVECNHMISTKEATTSKKLAEQAAAELALRFLKIDKRESGKSKEVLYAYCSNKSSNKVLPVYYSYGKGTEFQCILRCEYLADSRAVVTATSEVCKDSRSAQEKAAEEMISILTKLGLSSAIQSCEPMSSAIQSCDLMPSATQSCDPLSSAAVCTSIETDKKESDNSAQASTSMADLQTLLLKLGFPDPCYSQIEPPSEGQSLSCVHFMCKYVMVSAEGRTGKKAAEQEVAGRALNSLRIPVPSGGNSKDVFIKYCSAQPGRWQPCFHTCKSVQGSDLFYSFLCSVYINNQQVLQIPGEIRPTEELANQSAAYKALGILRALKISEMPAKDLVTILDNHLVEKKLDVAKFDYTVKDCHVFKATVTFKYIFGGDKFSSKKEAEKRTAELVMKTLFSEEQFPRDMNQCKNRLRELCVNENKVAPPQYEVIVLGEQMFICNISIVVVVKGNVCFTKDAAKYQAAQEALCKLKLDSDI